MSPTSEPKPGVIGVDIGGASVKAVLAGRDGQKRGQQRRPTPVGDSAAEVVDVVVELIDTLRAGSARDLRVVGVGLVMPGVVDRSAGVARYSANIGWNDLPIRRLVSDRVGLPVTIDHDVRAATVAEMRAGAARGVPDMLFVSIGTGLAIGTVSGGKIVDGAFGLAGEAGHMPVFPDGEPCGCGQRGCAEAYASGAAVARRYAARTGAVSVAADVVYARAADGDRVAATVVDEGITALTRMVLASVLINDPGVVVLGGGVSAAGAALRDPIERLLGETLCWRRPPRVTVSRFGADAGSYGACLLAWPHAGVGAATVPSPDTQP